MKLGTQMNQQLKRRFIGKFYLNVLRNYYRKATY